MKTPQSSQVARFGPFELNLRAGELRRNGTKIRLQEQSFQILAMLLEYPGELVTREDIQKKLWPNDTIVEFENSINAAIRRLRLALGDSADNPQYVDTLARRGYRFIGRLEGVTRKSTESVPEPKVGFRYAWIGALGLAVMVGVLLGSNGGGLRDRLLGGPASEEIRSLAVLPLENLSNEPEHFTLGMTEALTTELGKISALQVISHTTAKKIKERLKESEQSLSEIARQLNIDAVVEGSVLRSEGRIRIDVQLIQANPERHLWAESYERDLRNIFTLQSEVARAIADEIKVKLTPQEQVRMATSRPVNPEAHEAYLKGRFLFDKEEVAEAYKALEYFQQAIEEDPTYAMAYVGLADCYMWLSIRHLSQEEAYREANAAVLKALELDDTLAEAHVSVGNFKSTMEWDWAGAEREFKRALELNPNNAAAHRYYAGHLANMGRFEEGLREAKRAQELDPLSALTSCMMGYQYWVGNLYDEMIEHCEMWLELEPDSTKALACARGRPYVQKGRYEEAIITFQELVTRNPERPDWTARLGYAYAKAGKRDEARQILNSLEELSRHTYVYPSLRAEIHLALGEKGRAIELLEEGYEGRIAYMPRAKVDPRLADLRDDPRFQDLLRRMNFPE